MASCKATRPRPAAPQRRASAKTSTRSGPRAATKLKLATHRTPGRRPSNRERGRGDPVVHVPRHPRVRTSTGRRELPPQDPSTSRELSGVMQEIIRRDARRGCRRRFKARAEALAVGLKQLATELANATTAKAEALMAQNASSYDSSRNLFIGVAAGAIVLALLLGFVLSWSGDRPYSTNRHPPGRDRIGGLHETCRRLEPRRAGRAGREREPDERRAPASVQGAGGCEPAQVRLPRFHVARAADAAERDHRLLASPPRGHGRRGKREAARSTSTTSSRPGTTCSRSSTTCSTCRRSKRGRSSSR